MAMARLNDFAFVFPLKLWQNDFVLLQWFCFARMLTMSGELTLAFYAGICRRTEHFHSPLHCRCVWGLSFKLKFTRFCINSALIVSVILHPLHPYFYPISPHFVGPKRICDSASYQLCNFFIDSKRKDIYDPMETQDSMFSPHDIKLEVGKMRTSMFSRAESPLLGPLGWNGVIIAF